jgi:hypothetical protein
MIKLDMTKADPALLREWAERSLNRDYSQVNTNQAGELARELVKQCSVSPIEIATEMVSMAKTAIEYGNDQGSQGVYIRFSTPSEARRFYLLLNSACDAQVAT